MRLSLPLRQRLWQLIGIFRYDGSVYEPDPMELPGSGEVDPAAAAAYAGNWTVIQRPRLDNVSTSTLAVKWRGCSASAYCFSFPARLGDGRAPSCGFLTAYDVFPTERCVARRTANVAIPTTPTMQSHSKSSQGCQSWAAGGGSYGLAPSQGVAR